ADRLPRARRVVLASGSSVEHHVPDRGVADDPEHHVTAAVAV
ncbi:MAG: hypothetical protein AVDCRST_MAG11-2222, partial [uncultured Gemmatimonadaceae bacterium]